jgi:hypothetical protein
VTRTTLEKIADREQAVAAATEQIREQIEQLSTRLTDLQAEAADLAVARKVILTLDDEPTPARLPGVPDNPVYQHILTVLTETTEPLRAKDLCHTLDEGTGASQIETMRSKLKRLVAAGLVTEGPAGLFAVPHPRTDD